MREFDEYKKDVNGNKIKSGIKIFEKQLKGVEGKDILIDGILFRGIVNNHLNDMSTTKNQRGLNVALDVPVKKGSYVKEICSDEIYLVTSRVDNHYTYKTCTMDYCNQTLNWKGLLKPIPCYCDNSSYGTKGIVDSTYLTEYDGKILFYVQKNESTLQIKQGMRFVFDNNKNSVYTVVDINGIVSGEVLRLVMDKSEYTEGKDDLENNIAYNSWLDVEVPIIPIGELFISGEDEISKYDMVSYTVMNEDRTVNSEVWNISVDYKGNDTSVVAETDRGNNYIKIKNNGYMGLDIRLIFTLGDVEIIKEVRLVR